MKQVFFNLNDENKSEPLFSSWFGCCGFGMALVNMNHKKSDSR